MTLEKQERTPRTALVYAAKAEKHRPASHPVLRRDAERRARPAPQRATGDRGE